MALDLFSLAGIATWQERLNSSSRFADAAGNWAGRLLLVEEGDGDASRSVWVHVEDRRCQEARLGNEGDRADADFVLSASSVTWARLAQAEITPIAAALAGELHLRKGNVLSLLPHAKAAAELIAAAAGS